MEDEAELKNLGKQLTNALAEYDKTPTPENNNKVRTIEEKVYNKMTAGNLPYEVRDLLNALNEYDENQTPNNRDNVGEKYQIYFNNYEKFKESVSKYLLSYIKDRIVKMTEEQKGGRRRTKHKRRKVAKKSKKSRRSKKSKKSRKSKTSRRR